MSMQCLTISHHNRSMGILCSISDKDKYSLLGSNNMVMDLIGKILSVITILWGVFLLVVYWTNFLDMELFDDDEILSMACLNTISFTAITIGFLAFRLKLGDAVVIQSK